MATVKAASSVVRRQSWPGPKGHPFFGCLRAFQRDQLNFLRELQQTYGDFVRIPTVPGYAIHFLADPAAIEHVLVKNQKNYRKPTFLTRPIRLLLGNGLFSSEGSFWLKQRRMAQPAFVRGAVLQLAAPMTAALDALIQSWEKAPTDRTVDLVPEMMGLVLSIAGATLFGSDLGKDTNAVAAAQREIFAMVRRKLDNPLSLPLWIPTPHNRAFHRARCILDQIVFRLIEARRRGGATHSDLLELLLAARDEESGSGMSDSQLRDEVLTLLFAGHDTTSAGLSWAWYLLGKHPEVQEALHDEAAGALKGRTPTAQDLPNLPLAAAVYHEALRLYPPAPGLAREALEPDEIGGHPVRAKAILMPSQWVTHRHPAYWDEPNQFRPERFLSGRSTDRPKFAFFPFGGGPRVCIGNTFAETESTLVLAALAQRFHFRCADNREVEPDITFVLRPKGPVNLTVRKRG